MNDQLATNQFAHLAQPGLLALKPFRLGDPLRPASESIRLNANESLLGPSPVAIAAARQETSELHRYPDLTAGMALRNAIAERLSLDPTAITLGNGSNDVIDMIARVFAGPGDQVIYSQYGFALYRIVAQVVGAQPVAVPAKAWAHDLARISDAINPNTRVIFLDNPNNPTGTWFGVDELAHFMATVPANVVVVHDEAYHEYATSASGSLTDGTKLLKEFPNLVITRTFSKAYGLGALRVGYALSHPDVADLLNRVRQPFNVNRMALTAALAAYRETKYLQRVVQLTHQGLRQLRAGLDELGLECMPTAGNFLCVDVGDGVDTARALAEHGILITPLANYAMPRCVRISVGTTEENEILLQRLCQLVDGVAE